MHKICRCDQALSFRLRHHLCRQGLALAGTRQLRSQDPVPVHAYRTERVAGSERREGADEVGSGIRVRGGNGDVNDYRDEDRTGAETGTRTGVEANEGAQDGNEDGSGNGDGGGDPWTKAGWERGRERGRKREQ